MSEMLIAIRSGFVADRYLGLFEVTAGKTRVAPSVLREQPELEDYFERDVCVRGSDAERCETRSTFRGQTVAY